MWNLLLIPIRIQDAPSLLYRTSSAEQFYELPIDFFGELCYNGHKLSIRV